MMKTMAINDVNEQNGRGMMKVMGIYNRILDKAIIILGKNGYTEGSYTDFYVNRLIGVYAHHGNQFLREYRCEGKINGGLTTTEPATKGDVELTVIEPIIVEEADMVPEVTSLDE